ncbi:hypothetical protein IJG78_01625 [Candidatus Saccharibacteria bacterium]|nr:hypothetical protein [Candidatus Saccharibacteria bacterium]
MFQLKDYEYVPGRACTISEEKVLMTRRVPLSRQEYAVAHLSGTPLVEQMAQYEDTQTNVIMGSNPRVWIWVTDEKGNILEINLFYQIKELGIAEVTKKVADTIVGHLTGKTFNIVKDRIGTFRIDGLKEIIKADYQKGHEQNQ